MEFQIHKKERIYFAIMSIVSIAMYVGFIAGIFFGKSPMLIVMGVYAGFFLLLFKLISVLMLGHLKGSAIKISENQLPEIHAIVKKQAMLLGLDTIPETYLLQGNGMLNAFATRLSKKDFVVLFSDLLEVAYQEGEDVVSFIIGHELGHIKRKHIGFWKKFFTFPASFVPFLNLAYSRSREYTCDNIGCALAPQGAAKGLLLLCAGKQLYKKISVEQLLASGEHRRGFATRFAEIFSTHPHALKRIEVIRERCGDMMFDREYMTPHLKETFSSEEL